VNPRYDVDGRTAKLAAQLIADVIQGLASTRGAKS
jgi:arginase family enzyme